MPSYEYTCAQCGEFEAWQPIAEAMAPLPCPECHQPAARMLSSPHVRTSGAGLRYFAESRNEKSAHEPATEHRLKAGRKSAVSHVHAHARTHGHAHAHGPAKQGHRPWMIGH